MRLVKALIKANPVAAILEYDRLEILEHSGHPLTDLTVILEHASPIEFAESLRSGVIIPVEQAILLAPIDHQEVWAAGVTYKRSKTARMEESESAASCYDRVYESDRPELFFKASPHRVAGPGEPIRIRADSKWNVPEPELALVINSHGELVGYTIGNDVSSRDIEGENPLYLPQAKVYDQCCGLGPCIALPEGMPPLAEIQIELTIARGMEVVYQDSIGLDQMARSLDELRQYLLRDQTFPTGVFLLTGTGIVPDSSFTLQSDDQVSITISGIGTLENRVVQFTAEPV